MSRILAFLTLGLLATVALAAASVVAGPSEGKITICHKRGSQAAKTMDIPASAWSGHKQHGDHKGACTAQEKRGQATAPPQPPSPPPPTSLGIAMEGDGDLEGDATFTVEVANRGDAMGRGVHVEGTLNGEEGGKWKVRAPIGGKCTVDGERLVCDLADLAAGAEVAIRLAYDGDPAVCATVGISLYLTASNDETAGDDHVRDSVRAGACSPLFEGSA